MNNQLSKMSKKQELYCQVLLLKFCEDLNLSRLKELSFLKFKENLKFLYNF